MKTARSLKDLHCPQRYYESFYWSGFRIWGPKALRVWGFSLIKKNTL